MKLSQKLCHQQEKMGRTMLSETFYFYFMVGIVGGYVLGEILIPLFFIPFRKSPNKLCNADTEDFPMFIGAYNPAVHELDEWKKLL